MLGPNRLLAMTKDISDFQFINHSIILQFQGPFQEHLSPHQFGVSTLGGYEAIHFGIQTFIDLQPNWAMM